MRVDRLKEIGLVTLAGVLVAALVAVSVVALGASGNGRFELELAEDTPKGQQVLYAGSINSFLSSAKSDAYEFESGDIGFSGNFFWEDSSAGYTPGHMTVELHSVRGLFDVCLDSETVSDNGDVSAYWQDIEAGKYYVKLVRADGKTMVSASNVMFYWLEHDVELRKHVV